MLPADVLDGTRQAADACPVLLKRVYANQSGLSEIHGYILRLGASEEGHGMVA
jgi:hypothetical protein